MEHWNRAPALVLLVAACGCATVDPGKDYQRATERIEAATGAASAFRPDAAGPDAARTDALLAGGITADEAVQLALLNNPRVQAAIYRVGVGRAEVVQAGLLSNPALALSLRFPDGGGLANFNAVLAQNLAELWQIPYRVEAAERELDRVILDVAREASVAALDAKAAYFRAIRADRDLQIGRENVEVTRQLVELTRARQDAGVGNEVDVNLARSRHLEAELEVSDFGLNATAARTALAKLLGLRTPADRLQLVEPTATPTDGGLMDDPLIATARANRLDVQALSQEVAASAARIDLERSRFVRSLEVGVSVEQEARGRQGDRPWLSDTAWATAESGQLTAPSLQPRDSQGRMSVVGPEIGVELPIFDQNQAQVARAEFEHERALRNLGAAERDLMQDVRLALAQLRVAARNAAFYRDELLPLRERGLQLASEAYKVGRTTILAALEAQQDLLNARSGYAAAEQDAAVAQVALERVTGRPFAQLGQSTPASVPVPPEVRP